jgi:phospholipid/cholesterol/gamma-HCH transport system substrate-binding protein
VSRRVKSLITRPWILIGVAAAALFVYWAVGTRENSHYVRAQFNDAVDLASGLNVRYHGIWVGRVGSVKLQDGSAVVELGIDNKAAWPLHRGAVAEIRWGTLVGEGTRYIQLFQGPKSAPAIPNGGVISSRDTVTPTEFDQVFGIFNAPTRRHLRSMFDNIGAQVNPHAAQLGSGIHYSAPALASAAGLMDDLAYDRSALSGLVGSGVQTTQELASQQARISALIGVADTTFQTFASHSQQVQSSIQGMPSTFADVRSTLARLQPSIARLRVLMGDLAPGAARLPALAQVARPALVSLERVVPLGLRTVSTAQSSAPPVTSLLSNGVPFMRNLGATLKPFNPMLTCITPYAPELAGFFSNWDSFTRNYDTFSHYANVHDNEGASSLTSTPSGVISPQQFTQLTGEQYALPRPPGLNAGQPEFIPQCNYGPQDLNPADDPENTVK